MGSGQDDASSTTGGDSPNASMRFLRMLLGGSRVRGAARASRLGDLDEQTCRCSHPRVAHEHYRAGADCALCDCPKFHRHR
jgi:hypothetical protein